MFGDVADEMSLCLINFVREIAFKSNAKLNVVRYRSTKHYQLSASSERSRLLYSAYQYDRGQDTHLRP